MVLKVSILDEITLGVDINKEQHHKPEIWISPWANFILKWLFWGTLKLWKVKKRRLVSAPIDWKRTDSDLAQVQQEIAGQIPGEQRRGRCLWTQGHPRTHRRHLRLRGAGYFLFQKKKFPYTPAKLCAYWCRVSLQLSVLPANLLNCGHQN